MSEADDFSSHSNSLMDEVEDGKSSSSKEEELEEEEREVKRRKLKDMSEEQSYQTSEYSSLPEDYMESSEDDRYSVAYSIMPTKEAPKIPPPPKKEQNDLLGMLHPGLLGVGLGGPNLPERRRTSMFVGSEAKQQILPKRKASLEGKSVVSGREEDWRNIDFEELEREMRF